MKAMRHIRVVAVLILFWGGAFAPPWAAHAKVEAPVLRTKHALVVPFRFVQGHIILSLSLNGHPSRNFILDSGCSKSVLGRAAVATLGLPVSYNSALTLRLFAKVEHGGLVAQKVRIRVGRWTMLAGSVPVFDFNRTSIAAGFPVSGIIGYDYMRAHPILINYQSRTISIFFHHRLGRHISNLGLAGAQFTIPRQAPIIHAGLELSEGRHLEGTFTVDTGADSGIELNNAFVEKNKITAGERGRELTYISADDIEFRVKSTRIRRLTLGNISFARPVVLLPQGVNSGVLDGKVTDGEIGNQILQQCRWILFDPSDGRLILGLPSKRPRDAIAR